jgi:hypothetical protein
MTHNGGGVNGSLRWKDLALDILLPVDQEKLEAERAAHARRMASGAPTGNSGPQSAPQGPTADAGEGDVEDGEDEEEDEEEDEGDDDEDVDENDENGDMDED